MTLDDIAKYRLINQSIAASEFKNAKDVVKWMGAVQAQDFPMAKWAIGVRMLNSSENAVEKSISRGEIIRTHVMRPTWHLVPADDIYWMLDLTAARLISSSRSYNKNLGLTESVFNKSFSVLEKSLTVSGNLTREELAAAFNRAEIITDGNRLSHLLVRAELEALICNGPTRNGKHTYSLLRDIVPVKKTLAKDEALAVLANRYFTSHGPATLKDFVWWSGLTVKEASHALHSVKSDLIHETIGSEEFWLKAVPPKIHTDKSFVHILPAYDEYLISYKDRSASVSSSDCRKAFSSNGIFYPVIIRNGKVEGLWKRKINKEKVTIDIDLFNTYGKQFILQLEKSISIFGKYLNRETEINHVRQF